MSNGTEVETGSEETVLAVPAPVVIKPKQQEKDKADVTVFGDERQTVYVGVNYKIYQASTTALRTLVKFNKPPQIFIRGDNLVFINKNKETGEPIIEIVTEDILTTILNRLCNFFHYGSKKQCISENPPRVVIKDFLNNISSKKFEGIPVLQGITQCPIINLTGKIQPNVGYNEEYKLMYVTDKHLKISVPTFPTEENIKDSVAVLEDLLTDFPFCDKRTDEKTEGKASKANMMGTLIAAAIPALMYDKYQPFIIISKPTQGTGASFLCKMAHIIQTGKDPHMLIIPTKREEWSKLLLTCAIEGWTSMIFDNIDGTLYSPELAAAMTQKYQSGRILGVSQTARIKWMPMWIGNGINITLSGDMPRRCVPINLDAGVETPWLRSGFKHEDIIGYTIEHRGEILSAILTIVTAWIRKGKPKVRENVPQFQNFNEWRDIIGGILSIIPTGETELIDGELPTYGHYFLTNLLDMYEKADVGKGQWSEFMVEWYLRWNLEENSWVRISKLVHTIESTDAFDKEMRYTLPEEISNVVATGKDISKVIGHALHKQRDRVYRVDLPNRQAVGPRKGVLLKFESRKSENRSEWKLTEVKEKIKDAKSDDKTA